MAYTEPSPMIGYVASTLQTKMALMNYITLPFEERTGPNFTFFAPQRPTVVALNYDIVPPDKNNLSGSVAAQDFGTRIPFTSSEYNAFLRTPNARKQMGDKVVEALQIGAETALNAVLVTSTNTLALTTDNTFTRDLFGRGIARLQSYGVRRSDIVFVCGSEAVIGSLLDVAQNTAGGSLGAFDDGDGRVATVQGIPIFIDVQFTNDTGTGGTAAYMWAKAGVMGGIDAIDVMAPEKDTLTLTYSMGATMAYGFALTEGVADKRVLRFTNP